MPSFKSVFAAVAFLATANAKTIKITATSDNRFDPDSTTADKGDVLEFSFQGNHSIVAGDYQNPCAPLRIGTGFFSGFIDGDSVRCAALQILFPILALIFFPIYRARSSASRSTRPNL